MGSSKLSNELCQVLLKFLEYSEDYKATLFTDISDAFMVEEIGAYDSMLESIKKISFKQNDKIESLPYNSDINALSVNEVCKLW